MKYIKDADYAYISNKYHDTSKPFDSFARFIRHDAIFSPETGMDGDAIRAGILSEDEKHVHLPHPVRKALAVAFVLKNTRISCDSRDIFPAVNAIDRPLNATLIAKWNQEVFDEIIPDVRDRKDYFRRSGIAEIGPDYDHSVPVWDRVFALGFPGLLAESERIRASKPLTGEQEAFFEGIRITYEAVIAFVGRLAALAEDTPGSEKMAAALRGIQHRAPESFYEAMLVDYIYFMISEHIVGQQVRSLCNFDRLMYPYFENDLKNGKTEEELRTELAYFLLQFAAIGNYWNQPVFLGGCKADESTEINPLSYIFLDVYDQMRLYNPKLQLRIAASTPKDIILKALDMIRRGHNCIVLVSDAQIRTALMNAGTSFENARTCDVWGCYGHSPQGAITCGSTYINLLKPLEYALHKGCDGISGEFVGLECPDAAEYGSFDEFYAEYKRQLAHSTSRVLETVNEFDEYLAYINPQNLLSATILSCLESGKDALAGGAVENLSTINFGFVADMADSLAMIKKYVFDRRELTLAQLRDMLDRNFEGDELFRRRLLADRDKFGNNRELPDFFAKDVTDFAASCSHGKPNAKKRGGTWSCGYHVARMSYTQADHTAASPNGRKRGEELAKNCSASMGQNREGATAAVLSCTKIDALAITGPVSLDLGLLPASVRGEEGLEAMYGLVMTFIRRGGHAVHINVFDADTLRDAQQHPENYRDLQIRVCGWNVLWNDIVRVEQDGFIRQAESLV